jgi:hypothetical protein
MDQFETKTIFQGLQQKLVYSINRKHKRKIL